MNTDLDRLHKVVTGELQGRGCGTTFSKCHELAVCTLLKELDYIVVIISDYRDIDNYLLPMIDKVFPDYSLKFSKIRPTRIISNAIIIDFILAHKLYEDTRGYPDFYEVDMTRPMMPVGKDREHGYLGKRIANYDSLQNKYSFGDDVEVHDKDWFIRNFVGKWE